MEIRADFRHDGQLFLKLVRRVQLPEIFLGDGEPETRQRANRVGDRVIARGATHVSTPRTGPFVLRVQLVALVREVVCVLREGRRSFELEDCLHMCSRLLRVDLQLFHDDRSARTCDVSHRHSAGTASDTHAMTALRLLKRLNRSLTRSVRVPLNVSWMRSKHMSACCSHESWNSRMNARLAVYGMLPGSSRVTALTVM